ncbi:hypothetical protein C5L38_10595 [Streptomyces sp. WAC00288]|nr:hypothetical protein C5L38_10595 [Streptomyces sp. WAC00288]
MMVVCRPHRAVRSSGSEVRMVTGPGAARAVAASMASMACLWPCRPASARSAAAWRAIGSVIGSMTRRESVHSRAGRLMRGWTTSTRVAAEVITRRSSARARASQPVTLRSRRTALASPSLSRTRVPPGTAGERVTRCSLRVRPAHVAPGRAGRAGTGSLRP